MKYIFETYLFENLHQINVLIFSQPCSVENFYLLPNYFSTALWRAGDGGATMFVYITKEL